MKNHETQQFSRFFLKDLKPKDSMYVDNKRDKNKLRFSSPRQLDFEKFSFNN